MKIYRYDDHHLTYKLISYRWVVGLFIGMLVSSFIGGYVMNDGVEFDDLTEYEQEVLVLSITDTANNFSEEKLIRLMKQLNMQFPHIVLAVENQ